MAGDNVARLKSLNQSEVEVLHVLFRDQNFKVKEIAAELFKSEPAIRTNLTSIFKKLKVPNGIENKRTWVVDEYQNEYEIVFKGTEPPNNPSPEPINRVEPPIDPAPEPVKRVETKPEIYVKPPDPIVVEIKPTEEIEDIYHESDVSEEDWRLPITQLEPPKPIVEPKIYVPIDHDPPPQKDSVLNQTNSMLDNCFGQLVVKVVLYAIFFIIIFYLIGIFK